MAHAYFERPYFFLSFLARKLKPFKLMLVSKLSQKKIDKVQAEKIHFGFHQKNNYCEDIIL